MAIELNKEEIQDIIPSIQKYVEEEFGEEIGEMKAKFLLDYFLKEIGPYAYNQGVKDAENFFREKVEDLSGSCYEQALMYWPDQRKGRT